jgi:tight adherence protein B
MPGLWVYLFLSFFGVSLVAFSVGFKFLETQQRIKVEKVLKTAPATAPVAETKILKDQDQGSDAASSFLTRLAIVRKLEEDIRASGLLWRVEAVLLTMLALAVVGGLIGSQYYVLVFRELSIAGLALFLGVIPILYIRHKRSARLAEFERQFPEALDFMARSVRAGHAFSVSLELLASETPDPLGFEFRKLAHELNLGSPFNAAMGNLVLRVPLIDVRFFVSTVLLQRETGGNLAETLTNLAHLIRERFRLKGSVKAAAAHGKITATVLTLLPIVLAVGLSAVAPTYLSGMAKDHTGRYLILGSIIGQLLGFLVMKKIVDIKV